MGSNNQPISAPFDKDAEMSVLAAIILDGESMGLVADKLQTSDFYDENHATIYRACQNLYNKGSAIDQLTICHELDIMGKLTDIGGMAAVSRISYHLPTSVHIVDHTQILLRDSFARQLISVAQNIAIVGAERAEIDRSYDKAENLLRSLVKNKNTASLISPKERTEMAEERYRRLKDSFMADGVPFGFYKLDEITGGANKGEMIVIGARPGLGKTTFAYQIARAMSGRGSVLFASAEMSVDQMTDRDISQILHIPLNILRRGGYPLDMYDEIYRDGLGTLRNRDIFFLKPGYKGITTSNIRAAASEMQVKDGLAGIFVDYLQILGDEYGTNAAERVSYISRQLKSIAREMDVPVITLSQLSRALEARPDKRPKLPDLRESGSIEQDSDVVLFMYRDDYYYTEDTYKNTFGEPLPKGIMELSVAKQRQGAANIKLLYEWQEYDSTYQELPE